MTLNGSSAANAQRRDTSAGWKRSAEVRPAQAAERLASEKFAPVVDLLSPATVAKLTELLIARCVGKLDDATLLDLTDQLFVECERRDAGRDGEARRAGH